MLLLIYEKVVVCLFDTIAVAIVGCASVFGDDLLIKCNYLVLFIIKCEIYRSHHHSHGFVCSAITHANAINWLDVFFFSFSFTIWKFVIITEFSVAYSYAVLLKWYQWKQWLINWCNQFNKLNYDRIEIESSRNKKITKDHFLIFDTLTTKTKYAQNFTNIERAFYLWKKLYELKTGEETIK